MQAQRNSQTAVNYEPETIDHKIIDGKRVAMKMRAEVASRVERLVEKGLRPKIASISVGDNSAVGVYIRNQKKAAQSVGIDFDHVNLDASIGEDGLLEKIQQLNASSSVTGIIIQRPISGDISIKNVQTAINPSKDIEGMNPTSIGNIVYNDVDLGPCTAVAAVELLKSTPLTLAGLEVVMVGHSEIVGKPVAFLLMSEGATVTVCHHMTRNLAVHTRKADAVLIAVGKPGLLTGDMIKPGAAVIDIGINQITTDDGKTKIVGDVDFQSCAEVAGWITPVPGGVGPVTVAALLRNAIVAAERVI